MLSHALLALMMCVCVCAAYGGSLIEHCLMAVGLPGLCKVEQFEIAQGKWFLLISVVMLSCGRIQKESFCFFAAIFKIMEALQMAEDYMEKTADFSGRVSESQNSFLLWISMVFWPLLCFCLTASRASSSRTARRSRACVRISPRKSCWCMILRAHISSCCW